jgi:hypothetical protein
VRIYGKETAPRAGPSNVPTAKPTKEVAGNPDNNSGNAARATTTKARTTRNSLKTAGVEEPQTVQKKKKRAEVTKQSGPPPTQAPTNRMTSSVKMPAPGAKDAPKFSKERPSELNRFLSRMEDWYTKAGTSLEDRITELGKYADIQSEKEWRHLKTYKGKDWDAFKKELQGEYIEALDEEKGSLKELRRICKSHREIYSPDLAELQDLKREFIAEARCLLEPPAALSNREAVDKFLDCLSDEFRDKILGRLEVAEGMKAQTVDRRMEDRYDLDDTINMAITISRGARGLTMSRESTRDKGKERERSTSVHIKNEDVNTPEKRAAAVSRAMKTEPDIGETLAAFADEMKASRKTMENDRKTLLEDLARVFRQATPATPVVAPQQSLYRPTMTYNNATSGCFYCGEEEHRKDNCPHRASHHEKGFIIIDQTGRTKMADGKFIPMNGGATAKDRVEIAVGVKVTNMPKASTMLQGNGILNLAQIISSAPMSQDRTVEILDNMDIGDVIQYLATHHNFAVSEQEGF